MMHKIISIELTLEAARACFPGKGLLLDHRRERPTVEPCGAIPLALPSMLLLLRRSSYSLAADTP